MLFRSAVVLLLLLPQAARGQGAPAAPGGPWKPVLHVAAEPVEPLPLPEPEEEQLSTLTLGDLEQMALEHNPTLAAATARIEAARGRWVQVGLYPNPVVGYHATEIGTMRTSGAQGGFVRQRFITAGKRHWDRAVASMDVEQAEIELGGQELRVLSDVRVRFYDALVAQRRVELAGELAGIGDDLARTSRRLLKARQVSENDVLQAEIEAQEAHILLDNARNQHWETWRRLVAVVGVPTMPKTPLEGRLDAQLPSWQWEECYRGLLRQSPELAAAYSRVQRARFAVERASREWVPDVDVFVSVRHQDPTGDEIANVQVGVPIPIFDANQGDKYRTSAELAAAQNDVRRIELDLQDRLAVAFRRYRNAHQQVDRCAQQILARARKSLDLVTDGYDKGQVDYLTLLTTQRTFFEVNLAYLDALRELREATVVIENQLQSGSLTRLR